MEFLYKNYFNTTTMLTLDTGTISAKYLLDWEKTFKWSSDGYNDDLTSTSLTITYDETTAVSRIGLLSHNFKDYSLYYNGVTANTFALSGANTTVSDYSSNSDTSQFFTFSTVSVSSITLQMNKTISANAEKSLGYFLTSDLLMEFDRIPSAKNYKPIRKRKSVIHRMSDGGVRLHILDKKWSATIAYENITEAFKNKLETVFDLTTSFIYVPFGTATGWDAIIFETPWLNDFEFETFSDNYEEAGYKGKVILGEV